MPALGVDHLKGRRPDEPVIHSQAHPALSRHGGVSLHNPRLVQAVEGFKKPVGLAGAVIAASIGQSGHLQKGGILLKA